jgi:hypothetical protein
MAESSKLKAKPHLREEGFEPYRRGMPIPGFL